MKYLMLLSVIVASDAARLTDDHKVKLGDHFVTYGLGCFSDYTVTFEDIKALQSFNTPKSKDAACFFACILKKAGMLDAEGKVSPEATQQVATKVFDNKDELSAVVSVFQECTYVNDLKVSDGAKGCDRAKFVLQCIIDESNQEEQSARLTTPGEDGVAVEKSPFSMREIIIKIIKALLRIGCSGVNKESIHGRVLTKVVPGLDTVSALCNFLI